MIYLREISIDRDGLRDSGSYVCSLPFMRDFNGIRFDSPVTFFVGENGSGKSTLIEGIAVSAGFNPEGGSKNFNFTTRNSCSELHEYIKLVRNPVGKWRDGYFLRAESFNNVATNIEELDKIPSSSRKISESYGNRALHEQSHGESFMALMRERFSGHGLYILDEPEAALSPARLIAAIDLIRDLVENDSQFIISTHSPILTAYPGAVIYEITEKGIKRTEWKHTANYMLTKRFLDDPAFFLNQD